jgi:hypothetical protein
VHPADELGSVVHARDSSAPGLPLELGLTNASSETSSALAHTG